jgi:hypothetical protein
VFLARYLWILLRQWIWLMSLNFQSVKCGDKFYCTFLSFLSILLSTLIHCFIFFRLVTLSLSLYFSAFLLKLHQLVTSSWLNALVLWLLCATHWRDAVCYVSAFQGVVLLSVKFRFNLATRFASGYRKTAGCVAREKVAWKLEHGFSKMNLSSWKKVER